MQLYNYKEERINQRHRTIHAQAFHEHSLLLKATRSLSKHYIRSVQLREAGQLMHGAQLRLYGPAVLAFWNQKTQQRRLHKHKVLGADDFNEQRLQRKGLVTLIRYVRYRRNKQAARENAELF